MPAVHQLIIGAADGDAITNMAMDLRDGLRTIADSEIYAYWRHSDRLRDEVLDCAELPPDDEIDLLVYHLSIGYEPVHDLLMNRTCPIVLCYHNITPADRYEEHEPEFAAHLLLGRQEIDQLRSRVVLAIADSAFNARDLVKAGYPDVHVVPAGFSPSRLAEEPYDANLLGEMKRRFPNGYVVAVGQVLPHKRLEQVMQTVHLMNSTFWGNVGLVVCGIQRQNGYFQTLLRYQSRCAMVDIHFTGAVTDNELATYMRGARAYLGMSEHEGFCFPPVEAASMGVPVVIKGAGAIPESIAYGALILPEDAGPVLAAEAVHEVLTNQDLRGQLVARGFRRVRELENQSHVEKTVQLVAGVLA